MSQASLKQMLANEHSLDEQRIYNLACWAYGNGTDGGIQIAKLAGLPEDRAQRCKGEFMRMNDGIKTRFYRYHKRA